MIGEIKGKKPRIGKEVFIAENALVVGDVEIGDYSSIWFGCVVRGDSDSIRIGENTNIQDLSVIHVDKGIPAVIGSGVTVGHRCIIHGAKIGDNVLVGMGSVILNNVEVGENSIVAAGSVLPPRKVYPPGHLIMGVPAKPVRALTPEEIEEIKRYARDYGEHRKNYLSSFKKIL